jgi:hypothetical protein
MSVCQKLGIILGNKVVYKVKLEQNVFIKKLSPKLSLKNKSDQILLMFDVASTILVILFDEPSFINV